MVLAIGMIIIGILFVLIFGGAVLFTSSQCRKQMRKAMQDEEARRISVGHEHYEKTWQRDRRND